MFRKFNFDTAWAVNLITRITNDEDIPIEGDAIVKQVPSCLSCHLQSANFCIISLKIYPFSLADFVFFWSVVSASGLTNQCRKVLFRHKKESC